MDSHLGRNVAGGGRAYPREHLQRRNESFARSLGLYALIILVVAGGRVSADIIAPVGVVVV